MIKVFLINKAQTLRYIMLMARNKLIYFDVKSYAFAMANAVLGY